MKNIDDTTFIATYNATYNATDIAIISFIRV